jgi:MFS family permease
MLEKNRSRGKAAGLAVIGSGFAIITSGKLIPFVNSTLGADGWRTNWLILAGIVGVIAVLSLLVIRNRPSDIGLLPLGS